MSPALVVFPTFRHGLLSHVKVIHGTFILSSTIRRHPCSAVLAGPRNQQSIAFVNVSPELNGSMSQIVRSYISTKWPRAMLQRSNFSG